MVANDTSINGTIPVRREPDPQAPTISNGFARHMPCIIDGIVHPPFFPGKVIYTPRQLAAVVAAKLRRPHAALPTLEDLGLSRML